MVNQSESEIVNFTKDLYQLEGCGICHQEGADLFFFTNFSRCAHQTCYNLFEPFLSEKLDQLYNKTTKYNYWEYHIRLIELIEKYTLDDKITNLKQYITDKKSTSEFENIVQCCFLILCYEKRI